MSDATLVFGVKTDGALQELNKLLQGIERFSNSITEAMSKAGVKTGRGLADGLKETTPEVTKAASKLAVSTSIALADGTKVGIKAVQAELTSMVKAVATDTADVHQKLKAAGIQTAADMKATSQQALIQRKRDLWEYLEAGKKTAQEIKLYDAAVREDMRRTAKRILTQQMQDTWVHAEAQKKASEMTKLHEMAIAEDIRRAKKQSLIQQGREYQLHLEREKQMAQAQVATLTRIRNEAASFKSLGLNVMGQAPIQLDPRMQSAMTRLQSKGVEDAAKGIKDMGDKAKAAKPHIQGLTDVSRDLHSAARGLAGSFGATWLTWGNTIPLAATAALGASLRQAIKLGGELEYQLTFVKALSGATSEQVSSMSSLVTQQAQSGLFSPTELANGLRILSQAGLDANASMFALSTTTRIATVGEMSMADAALNLVGVMNAFNLSVTDIPHIGDVFSKAAAVSQTSVAAMTEAMKTASVAGAMYGATMEDTAVALTTLAKLNITGTAAGTSYRNMLKEIYAPSKGVAEVWKQMGVSARDATGQARPFADVIYDLKDKLKEYDQLSQINILQKLFGERGSKEAIAMLAMTRDEWEKLKASIKDSDGFAAKVSAQLEQTVKGGFIQAFNTLKVTLVDAFNAITPEVKALAANLKELFGSQQFKDAAKGAVALMVDFAQAVVKVGGILVEWGRLIGVATTAWIAWRVTALLPSFEALAIMGMGLVSMTLKMGQAVTATGGLTVALNALRVAFLSNPLGLILVGLATATAAVVLYWDELTGAKADARLSKFEQDSRRIQAEVADQASAVTNALKAEADEREKLIKLREGMFSGHKFDVKDQQQGLAFLREEVRKANEALRQSQAEDSFFTSSRTKHLIDKAVELRQKLDEAEAALRRIEVSKGPVQQYGEDRVDRLLAKAAAMGRPFAPHGTKTFDEATLSRQKSAVDEYNKALDTYNGLVNKSNDLQPDFYEKLEQIQNVFRKKKDLEEYMRAYQGLIEQQPFYQAELAKTTKEQTEFVKAQEELQKGFEKETEGLEKEVKALEAEGEKLRLNKEDLGDLTLQRIDDTIAIKEQRLAVLDATAQCTAESEALRVQIDLLKQKRALTSSNQIAAEFNNAAKESEKAWTKFADDIERALTDSLMRGFESGKSFGRNFIDSLKNMLKTAALKIVVQAIVDPIMGSVRGMMGGQQAGGAAGAAQGVSFLSQAGQLASNWNGAGLSSFALSGVGQSLGLSSTAQIPGYFAGDTAGAAGASLTPAGSILSAMPIGGIFTAYQQGGIGGFASGVASTAIAGGIAGMAGIGTAGAAGTAAAAAGGSAFMGGMSAAMSAIPVWGWAAMAAAAIFGGMGGSTPHKGGMSEFSAAGGLQTGKVAGFYDTNSGFGGGSASTDAQTITGTSATVQGLVGMFDSLSTTFGGSGGYKVATGFADDDSSDGAWGALRISQGDRTVLDWGDTRTSKWAPREFADGKQGAAQYQAELAASTLQVLNQMDLPAWADNVLTSLGKAPSMEKLAQAVDYIGKLKPVADKLMDLGVAVENITPASIEAAGGIDALTQMLDALPNIGADAQAAFEEVRLSSMSSASAFHYWTEKANALRVSFDGSVSSAQALGAAMQNRYQAEVQLIQQIQTLVESIHTSVANIKDQFLLDTLDPSGQYDFYDNRMDSALSVIKSSTDPDIIQMYADRYMSDLTAAWGLLSQEQRIQNLDAFQADADLLDTVVADQTAKAVANIETSNTQFLADLSATLISSLTGLFSGAAAELTTAAATPHQVNVTIDVVERGGGGGGSIETTYIA